MYKLRKVLLRGDFMELQNLSTLLSNLGINIAASAIYDHLKTTFISSEEINREALLNDLSAFIKVENASVKAERIINFI